MGIPEGKERGRKQIKIQTNDDRENMERIVSYAKESESLEIVFDREKITNTLLCMNGVYLFGVSRIKLDEENIELFLRLENEKSQKEYRIHTRFDEKGIEIYKKYKMIYIVYLPYERDDPEHIGIPLSNKENLRLGHSIYQ